MNIIHLLSPYIIDFFADNYFLHLHPINDFYPWKKSLAFGSFETSNLFIKQKLCNFN